MSSMSSTQLAERLSSLAHGIAGFISGYLQDRDDFGMRSFYGEAFSLALLQRTGLLTSDTEAKLLRAFDAKDRTHWQYHWEFNHYGMLEAGRLRAPLEFRNTPATNWTLLRANVRVRADEDGVRGSEEAEEKIERMQCESGLILDDRGVRSFQYHCFSAAMLFELHRETGRERFLQAFLAAVSFIRNFILPNGDALYVGRGQQQSFGYASLAYILAAAYSKTGDATILGDLQRVIAYVCSFVRADGSLPLVMRAGDEPLPHPDAPHRDQRYPGWYAYNNYFDYLPFAGVFLAKAAAVLNEAPAGRAVESEPKSYRDRDFLKIVSGTTIAVLGRTGGYWTNDLPVPYVYRGDRVRTSCYGGEQFGGGIYTTGGIPLPISRGGRSLRWRSWSCFLGNRLIVIAPLGVLIRRFSIHDGRVEIDNQLFSPFKLRDRYLLSDDVRVAHSEYPLVAAGTEYCASGPLRAVESNRVGRIVLEFP